MKLYAIIAFIILTFCSTIVFLCYWIPKKLGSPKTGKILAWLVGFALLCPFGTVIFEDQFFTKTNAKNLLLEQKIVLNDPFEIIENKSMSAYFRIQWIVMPKHANWYLPIIITGIKRMKYRKFIKKER